MYYANRPLTIITFLTVKVKEENVRSYNKNTIVIFIISYLSILQPGQ